MPDVRLSGAVDQGRGRGGAAALLRLVAASRPALAAVPQATSLCPPAKVGAFSSILLCRSRRQCSRKEPSERPSLGSPVPALDDIGRQRAALLTAPDGRRRSAACLPRRQYPDTPSFANRHWPAAVLLGLTTDTSLTPWSLRDHLDTASNLVPPPILYCSNLRFATAAPLLYSRPNSMSARPRDRA